MIVTQVYRIMNYIEGFNSNIENSVFIWNSIAYRTNWSLQEIKGKISSHINKNIMNDKMSNWSETESRNEN